MSKNEENLFALAMAEALHKRINHNLDDGISEIKVLYKGKDILAKENKSPLN
jgi:hypothetical protein